MYGCQESKSTLYHCTSLIREIINWEELAAQQVPEILYLTPSPSVTGMHHHALPFDVVTGGSIHGSSQL